MTPTAKTHLRRGESQGISICSQMLSHLLGFGSNVQRERLDIKSRTGAVQGVTRSNIGFPPSLDIQGKETDDAKRNLFAFYQTFETAERFILPSTWMISLKTTHRNYLR